MLFVHVKAIWEAIYKENLINNLLFVPHDNDKVLVVIFYANCYPTCLSLTHHALHFHWNSLSCNAKHNECDLFQFNCATTSNIVIGGGLKSRSIFFILMTSNIRKLQKLKTTLSDLLYRVFFYVFVDLSRAPILLMRQRIPRSKQGC